MSQLNLRRRESENIDCDFQDIVTILGGERDGPFIRCPSPGYPENDRSCFVRVNPAQPKYFFIYDCIGSKRAAYAIIRAKLDLVERPAESLGAAEPALQILDETVSAAGTLVERYLASRGLRIPCPDCLRFHPRLFHRPSKSRWPAMVAVRSDISGNAVAVHRTFLKRDGTGKAPVDPQRMDLGPSRAGALRLAPESASLLIGEGIETTLSAMQATGRPGWAAGSAIALRNLVLPASVRAATILADGDEAGEGAANAAAARWLSEGRRVRIARAPAGKDFNDLLQEGGTDE